MENNESIQEFLTKNLNQAMKGEERDCVIVKEQWAKAIINGSVLSDVRNGFVTVKTENSFMEWEVKEGEVIKCPKPIHIGIKNLKVIAGCIGDKEPFYFKLKNSQNMQSPILSICAVIEVDECSIAFYYNGETNKSYYTAQMSFGNESTDLFVIAKYLRDLEVTPDGEKETAVQWNELEMDETATKSALFEDAYQW